MGRHNYIGAGFGDAALLAIVASLDTEIRQTDHEISDTLAANQQSPTALSEGQATFAHDYWQPFMAYWGRVMGEVAKLSAPDPRPHSYSLSQQVVAELQAYYYKLRRDAGASFGFDLTTPLRPATAVPNRPDVTSVGAVSDEDFARMGTSVLRLETRERKTHWLSWYGIIVGSVAFGLAVKTKNQLGKRG